MTYVTVLVITLYLGVQIHCIRVWLLYFNLRISQILKNRNWQAIINPQIFKNNWYLNPVNQRRFGHGNSGKTLIIFAIVISTILSIIQVTFYLIDRERLIPNRKLVFAGIAVPSFIVFVSAVKYWS